MKVLNASQSKELDKTAIEDFGIPGIDLMNEAGRAIASEILKRYNPDRVLIVCGKGNNAGDGFVVAQQLLNAGIDCLLYCLYPPASLTGDALRAWNQFRSYPILPNIHNVRPGDFDLIVDALLGTGTKGTLRKEIADSVNKINSLQTPVVSIDVPTGVRELNEEEEQGPAVHADLTITIGTMKTTLLTYPGLQFAPKVIVVPINFPSALLENPSISVNYATETEMSRWLPQRLDDSHKGTFGHVGVLAGSPSYAGAAIFTAKAALKSGCGLCTIVCAKSLNVIYKIALPEALTLPLDENTEGSIAISAIDKIAEFLDKISVLAIGPGLGTLDETKSLVLKVLSNFQGPAVIDADALNILGESPDLLRGKSDWILTPHPKEMSRLTGKSVAEIQKDRIGAAQDFARSYGINILLKGVSPIIASPDGQAWIVPGATSALAKGGSGDVLTGLIAALMAQNIPPLHAAILGASCHLDAAKACQSDHTEYGVLATDLCAQLPHSIKKISLVRG